MIGSALDIVEPDNGNIRGNLSTVVHESAYGSDGSDVVIANECCEIGSALNEFVGRFITEFGSRNAEF